VIAWQYPSTYGWAPYPDGLPDLEGMVKRALIAALNEVSGLEPGVLVRPIVTEGHAAGALLDAARGADLLVVGSRGHGGFAAALLGSVSMLCVLHAPCSVLVFRDETQAAAGADRDS